MKRIRRTRPTVKTDETGRVRRTRPATATAIPKPPAQMYFPVGTRFKHGSGEYEIVGMAPGSFQVKCITIMGKKSEVQPRSWFQDVIVARCLLDK